MVMMHIVVFFVLVFFVDQGNGIKYECDTKSTCGCSTSSTVLTKIIGGEAAIQGYWSWSVSLRSDGSHFCGGSIISPLFILTAAHCTQDILSLSSVTILAGSVTLKPSSSNKFYQIRSVKQIYQHSDFNPFTFSNDLALIRLPTPLNMINEYTKPICLPTGTSVQPPNNIDMIAVGWGVTDTQENTVSPILRQVTVKSIDDTSSDCKSVIYDAKLQFCAGKPEGGKDTCQGDSGGPIMAFVNGLWQLDGLTSYGYGCALPHYPGVYTRVSHYVSWIKSILRPYEVTTVTTRKPTIRTTTKKRTTTTTTKKAMATTKTTKKPVVTTTTTKKPVVTTVHCYNWFFPGRC